MKRSGVHKSKGHLNAQQKASQPKDVRTNVSTGRTCLTVRENSPIVLGFHVAVR